jgi:hypothetical protein
MQGFDKTSDTLDTPFGTQKVVLSSMEEEVYDPVQKRRAFYLVLVVLHNINKYLHFLFTQDYSSSGLHALSSYTDSGVTCSSSVPGKTQLLVFSLPSFSVFS